MQKIKKFFDRIFHGESGWDDLGKALFLLAGILVAITIFFRSYVLAFTALALMLFGFYRMVSENTEARAEENHWFTELKDHILKADFSVGGDGYAYFRCPNCGQMVRVPKGKGRIDIRCPKCGTKFRRRT